MSSSEVWYSGYVPYFDLITDTTGKSTPGYTRAAILALIAPPIEERILVKVWVRVL
jgi:hypothetical protein